MLKLGKTNDTPIVTLNPYEYEGFRFYNSAVDALSLSKNVSKHDFFISYIEYKDIITATLNISRTTDDDDLENIISVKIYEELSLDPAIDYKIVYFESKVNTEERIFNVFIIASETINKTFKNISKRVSFIDYVAVEPLLYGAIYKKGLLPSTQTDCFLTIRADEAFVSIYVNGEYLTSRSIRYTLNYLRDKFVEQSGERISSDKFADILKTKGLVDKEEEGFNYDLNTIFEDCIFYVNDTINIINRIYNVNTKNIFIDCDYKIEHLEKFINTKLDINVVKLNTNTAINSKNLKITERHNIMALYARFYEKEGFNADFNFSNMLRPDPFTKRKSGKFILTCAAAFCLSMLYPLYNYIAGEILDKDSQRLNDELSVLNAQATQIKNTLARLKKEQDEVKTLTVKEEERLNFRKGLLQEIENKKDNYAMKGLNLFEITDMINDNGVFITNIANNDRNLTITTVSDNEKRITQLIKDISKMPKYSVNTKKIKEDKRNNEYESNISIEIRQWDKIF